MIYQSQLGVLSTGKQADLLATQALEIQVLVRLYWSWSYADASTIPRPFQLSSLWETWGKSIPCALMSGCWCYWPFTKILVKHSTAPCIKAAILKFLRSSWLFYWIRTTWGYWGGTTTCLDDGAQNGKQYKLSTLPLFQARRLRGDGPLLSYISFIWIHRICGSIETIDYTDLLDPLCWTSTDNSIYGLRRW